MSSNKYNIPLSLHYIHIFYHPLLSNDMIRFYTSHNESGVHGHNSQLNQPISKIMGLNHAIIGGDQVCVKYRTKCQQKVVFIAFSTAISSVLLLKNGQKWWEWSEGVKLWALKPKQLCKAEESWVSGNVLWVHLISTSNTFKIKVLWFIANIKILIIFE